MPTKTFRAVVEREDVGVFVRIPFDVKEVFGKARPKVRAQIGRGERTVTAATYGGKYFLGLPKAFRESAALQVGDTVSATIGDT